MRQGTTAFCYTSYGAEGGQTSLSLIWAGAWRRLPQIRPRLRADDPTHPDADEQACHPSNVNPLVEMTNMPQPPVHTIPIYGDFFRVNVWRCRALEIGR
jgi:hypothetical protein